MSTAGEEALARAQSPEHRRPLNRHAAVVVVQREVYMCVWMGVCVCVSTETVLWE